MTRMIRRTLLLACVVAAMTAAAFAQVASANYFGGVNVTCTTATYNYSTFPSGDQTVRETIWIDGALAKEQFFTFAGPTGTDTVQFTVPNDGLSHFIEANSYSITNATPIFGLPGVATLTCGSAPPPPSVCTYTKGYYRNHPGTTASVIAGMGGTVKVGASNLNAAQAQAILNTVVGQPSNVTYTSNLLLNLVQQLIAAELNIARGSTASAGLQSSMASANAAITVGTAGGGIQLSTGLSTDAASALNDALAGFNTSSDCGS
jgi:hypothetical protein